MLILLCLPMVAGFLYHETHRLHALAVFRAGGNDIDAGGVDAAVTEDVGELGDILLQAVEHAGKQMPQVMREDLAGIDVGLRAEGFHLSPDVRPADRLSCACDEDTARNYALLRAIAEQLFCSSFTRNTERVFPLHETTASPLRAASTVMNSSSLTRMPVPQIV